MHLNMTVVYNENGFSEAQSGYFGKSGMSVHITHCYAKINNQVYHHALHHIFESSKQVEIIHLLMYSCSLQGSSDVALILRHAFSVLEEKGITRVTLRSDNAACYKSAELIGDLYQLSNDSLDLSRYIYSEPQAGKVCQAERISPNIDFFEGAVRQVSLAHEKKDY